MSFQVKRIGEIYYVADNTDMYGPFNTYKEATNFMEDQIGLLYENGAMDLELDDNHYRE